MNEEYIRTNVAEAVRISKEIAVRCSSSSSSNSDGYGDGGGGGGAKGVQLDEDALGGEGRTITRAKPAPPTLPAPQPRLHSKLPPQVLVYTWHRYHTASNGFVCDADEEMAWDISYEEGADGVILWGHEVGDNVEAFEHYWTTDFAPMALKWTPP